MASSNFAAPIGINRLLECVGLFLGLVWYLRTSPSYLEHPGEDPAVKPWFWIIWLFVGPMVGSISFQWYIFMAVSFLLLRVFHAANDNKKTRTLVRCEAIVTQLVFEHALRIRVKAETAEKKSSSSGTSTPADSEAPSPIDQEDSSGDETLNSTDADALSRDETLQASSSSIKSTTSSKAKGKGKEEPADEDSSDGSNLVGKITNLVSAPSPPCTSSCWLTLSLGHYGFGQYRRLARLPVLVPAYSAGDHPLRRFLVPGPWMEVSF